MFTRELQDKIEKGIASSLQKAGLPGGFFPMIAAGINQMRAGGQIEISRVVELQKALSAMDQVMKAGDLGTLLQGQAFTGNSGGQGELAPFTPQSMSQIVTLLGAGMPQLWARKRLPRRDIQNITYEAAVVNRVGNPHIPAWMSEGGGGTLSTMSSDRKIVTIKQHVKRRQTTFLAQLVNMLGVNTPVVGKNALENESWTGMVDLELAVEDDIWNADSVVHPLAFDGLYKQLAQHTTPAGLPTIGNTLGNYVDKRNTPVTGPDLLGFLGSFFGAPFWATPTVCVVDGPLWGTLQQAAQDMLKFNQSGQNVNGSGALQGFVFGAGEIWIVGPAGNKIPVECAPLSGGFESRLSATTADGEAPPVISAFTLAVGSGITVGANGASKFTAADAGTYRYRFFGVGDKGISAPLTVPTNAAAVTVASGDAVSFVVPDAGTPGHGGAATQVRYYIVERTAVNGAAGTEKVMWRYPVNTDGGGGNTLIVDANLHIPDTSRIYLLSLDPQYLLWISLLETFRYPLPAVDTIQPFLLLNFGNPWMIAPIKHALFDNVKRTL